MLYALVTVSGLVKVRVRFYGYRFRVRVRIKFVVLVKTLQLFDQDEAARSAGEGSEKSTESTRETRPPRREEGWVSEEGGRLGPQGGREAGHPRRGKTRSPDCWAAAGVGGAAEAGTHWCAQYHSRPRERVRVSFSIRSIFLETS